MKKANNFPSVKKGKGEPDGSLNLFDEDDFSEETLNRNIYEKAMDGIGYLYKRSRKIFEGDRKGFFSGRNRWDIDWFTEKEFFDVVKPNMSYYTGSHVVSRTRKKTLEIIEKIISSPADKMMLKFIASDVIKDYMIRDIYKLYYNQQDDVVIEPVSDNSLFWGRLLLSMDNYMLKMVTENKSINSLDVASNILAGLIMSIYNNSMNQMSSDMEQAVIDMISQVDSEDSADDPIQNLNVHEKIQDYFENMKNHLNQNMDQDKESDQKEGQDKNQKGKSQKNKKSKGDDKDPNSQKSSKNLEDLEKDLRNIMQNFVVPRAVEEINKREEMMNSLGFSLDQGNLQETEEGLKILEYVSRINLNKRDIIKFVKDTIKRFRSSVALKDHPYEEELLESDFIEDLINEELLFNDIFLEDVHVVSHRQKGKFNLYIDISGSMDAMTQYSEQDSSIQMKRLDLAKILAFKLYNMNYINDIYFFESDVHGRVSNIESLLMQRCTGGTDLEKVMKHALKEGKPALIITDGESHINTYYKSAFMLCIETGFNVRDGYLKMLNNNQIAIYRNGTFDKQALEEVYKRSNP